MTERVKAIDEAKLRSAGVDALNKALGPLGAVRFLALFRSEPTDYVEVSRRLYENQSVWRRSSSEPKNIGGDSDSHSHGSCGSQAGKNH